MIQSLTSSPILETRANRTTTLDLLPDHESPPPMPADKPRDRRPPVTEHAHLDTCPRCHRYVLRGLANGFDTLLDPTRIDPAGELAMLLEGRSSYDAWTPGDHTIELIWRGTMRQRAPRMYPVHATHRCGQPVPPARDPQPPTRSRTTRRPIPDEPEF